MIIGLIGLSIEAPDAYNQANEAEYYSIKWEVFGLVEFVANVQT